MGMKIEGRAYGNCQMADIHTHIHFSAIITSHNSNNSNNKNKLSFVFSSNIVASLLTADRSSKILGFKYHTYIIDYHRYFY